MNGSNHVKIHNELGAVLGIQKKVYAKERLEFPHTDKLLCQSKPANDMRILPGSRTRKGKILGSSGCAGDPQH